MRSDIVSSAMAVALALPMGVQAQSVTSPTGSPLDTTAVHITAVVQRYVDALMARDTAYIRAASLPSAVSIGLRETTPPGDIARARPVDEVIKDLAQRKSQMLGRIWSPRITVTGRIANFVAPYDVYYDGQFTACGVDHYLLVWSGSRWMVSQLVFTQQTSGCPMHPKGPPR